MKIFIASAFLLLSLSLSRAQSQSEIPLWPNGAPGALGNSSNDIPTITPFLPPANASGAAMV
ncbi:MAG TPA: alpha/beta hydrolase, partial [Verrucomicrobiae bacterium]|nr:alpha/beta hydrolase [Verrucomicrobiae bacterium]